MVETQNVIHAWCGKKPGFSPTKLLEDKNAITSVKRLEFSPIFKHLKFSHLPLASL